MSPDPDGDRVLSVDATELGSDAVALDALARLALTAKRCGYQIVVQRASPELIDLIALAGLTETLCTGPVRSGSTPPRC